MIEKASPIFVSYPFF